LESAARAANVLQMLIKDTAVEECDARDDQQVRWCRAHKKISLKPFKAPAIMSNCTGLPTTNPGNNLFARSFALNSETASMRQVFNWAQISIRIVIRITNPKLADNCSVNTVVWVRNPGPIAEVAIRKAAPSTAPLLFAATFLYCFNA